MVVGGNAAFISHEDLMQCSASSCQFVKDDCILLEFVNYDIIVRTCKQLVCSFAM